MGEIIYVRMHHRISVENKKQIVLGDVAKLIGPSHLVEKLNGLGATIWREALSKEEVEQLKNT